MDKVLGCVLVVAVFWMAMGCSETSTTDDTGTKTPDIGGADKGEQPDTATLPDQMQPDQAIKPDTVSPAAPKWAVAAGGTGDHVGESIAVDSSGNSYVTGYFKGTATFGSTTLTSKGWGDIFVARLDRNGNFISAESAGGTECVDPQPLAA